jgi:hypothetical protein
MNRLVMVLAEEQDVARSLVSDVMRMDALRTITPEHLAGHGPAHIAAPDVASSRK